MAELSAITTDETEPPFEKVKAIDVVPDHWGVWCTVGCDKPSRPFVNQIVLCRWTPDGAISFMLDTHNFMSAEPDEVLDLVRLDYPPTGDFAERLKAEHAAFVAKRPGAPRQGRGCELSAAMPSHAARHISELVITPPTRWPPVRQ